MQAPQPLRNIVVVGGGTAGWMSAAALAATLRGRAAITLVESDEIGTIGVGEATIPMMQRFHERIGLPEAEFMAVVQGTYKLGIEFVDWGRLGERYLHGFSRVGQELYTLPFEQYWHALRAAGRAGPLAQYSINHRMAEAGRFMPAQREPANSPLNHIGHAYHLDAGLYAQHLRRRALAQGVRRIEGRVEGAVCEPQRGHVAAVVLAGGQRVEGELFVDCSGFRGLLIEQTLHTGYEDWSHWLPCDRALAVPSRRTEPLLPYTRATARTAGWQWRIPLQHRTGNGLVYCSSQLSDDEAAAQLLAGLDSPAMAEPRALRFATGRRRKVLNGNVLAVGLSSGFLEPLESTSIYLIQSTLQRLIDFFPDTGFNPVEEAEFNRRSAQEMERIRDFIILHYKLTQRDDSPFWRDCAAMVVPDSLQHKLDLFAQRGQLLRIDNELFTETSWHQVMTGQNLWPRSWHPLVGLIDKAAAEAYLRGVAEVIERCVQRMPDHAAYVAQHCAAESPSP